MLALPLLTLVPGSRRVSGSPYAWDCRMWWNGLYSIPTQQLETRLGPGGEKRVPHIRDSLFEHVNKKGLSERTWESPSHLNVLYKSFHGHRNMSRFWSFPLISFRPDMPLSPLINGLTPHEVRAGGIIFSSLLRSGPGSLTELSLSPWPMQSPGPRVHGPRDCLATFQALCRYVFRQHISGLYNQWGYEPPPVHSDLSTLTGTPGAPHRESKGGSEAAHRLLQD